MLDGDWSSDVCSSDLTELMVKTKVIQEELETRKLVERAKEILMQRMQLNGEAAYRWLQKQSMDSRKSMRQVAEAVLLTQEINLK
jgi:AmiR/NasT family two-component response regulator